MTARTHTVLATALTAGLAITLSSCATTSSGGPAKTPATSTAHAIPTEAQAYQQATSNYRRWLQLRAEAINSGRPLPAETAKVATPQAISKQNAVVRTIWGPSTKVVKADMRYDLLGAKGAERRLADGVSPWTLSLQVCTKNTGQAVNIHGVNVAVYENNGAGLILFRSLDKGHTWLVDDESNLKGGSKCSATNPSARA